MSQRMRAALNSVVALWLAMMSVTGCISLSGPPESDVEAGEVSVAFECSVDRVDVGVKEISKEQFETETGLWVPDTAQVVRACENHFQDTYWILVAWIDRDELDVVLDRSGLNAEFEASHVPSEQLAQVASSGWVSAGDDSSDFVNGSREVFAWEPPESDDRTLVVLTAFTV